MSSSSSSVTSDSLKQAMELTKEQHQRYREAFNLFDRDGDDSISPDELGLVMRQLGHDSSDAELAQLVKTFDLNRNGKIEFFEFVRKMDRRLSDVEEERELRAAFELFDTDKNGFIDKNELRQLMSSIGEKMNEAQIEEIIAEADLDGDQLVNFEEFAKMMNKDKTD